MDTMTPRKMLQYYAVLIPAIPTTDLLRNYCPSDNRLLVNNELSRRWNLVWIYCLLCPQPIALVSWGRTLELSTAASSEVCDWLETTTSTTNKSGGASDSRKYNLLLTRSAEQPQQQQAYSEEQAAKMKVSEIIYAHSVPFHWFNVLH